MSFIKYLLSPEKLYNGPFEMQVRSSLKPLQHLGVGNLIYLAINDVDHQKYIDDFSAYRELIMLYQPSIGDQLQHQRLNSLKVTTNAHIRPSPKSITISFATAVFNPGHAPPTFLLWIVVGSL